MIELQAHAAEVATFGGGCFWCIEASFAQLNGVQKVQSGYAGGQRANPSYEQVSSGATGHAEVVQVTFDPAKITYIDLLKVFFTVHDPTTLNQQGNDVGTQYRSVIFYHNPRQQALAKQTIEALNKDMVYERKKVVTQLLPLPAFYVAEGYHQDYYANNANQPYCRYVIAPKIEKLEKVFKHLLKKQKP